MNTTIEDALHAWVVASSGLPAGQVIWSRQAGPRPATAYIEMRILNIDPVASRDWADTEYDAGLDAVTMFARGMRQAVLALQAYGGAPTGATQAAMLLSKVRLGAALPTYRDALSEAGAGLSELGSVRALDALVGDATLESRATMEIRFFFASEISITDAGTVEIIETSEIENEDTAETFTTPAP